MENILAHINGLIDSLSEVNIVHLALRLVLATAIAIFVYIVFRFLFKKLVAQADKFAHSKDNKVYLIAIDAFKNSKSWFFAAFALFASAEILELGRHTYIPLKILTLAAFIQIGIWLSVIFRDSLINWSEKNNQSKNSTVTIMMLLGKFFIWAAILLLILDNLGVKVVSLLAGFGIGGIAVALAVQKILGDLFASVSIMLDKPFEVGDLINIDSVTGFVESIGVKTTRIRSITGEQVIISNSDLLESRVNNLKRMAERRITLPINASPGTSNENLKSIVDIVKNIIGNQENARFDRGHLKNVSASSVDYEFVYWVTKPDYLTYMDVQEKINLKILDAFAERKISLAYPAQRVLLEKN
jgi:small-conductance mechanosensitive channel